MPSTPTTPPTTAPRISARLLVRVLLGALGFVGAGFVLGVVAREPLERAATWFVDVLGALGLFVGVMICDVLPFPPIASEPLLVLARVGGLSFSSVWALASGASFCAGLVGYGCGRVLGTRPVVVRLLERAGVAPLMRRYGPLVVALAAVSPLPYAPATWSAGALRLPLLPFALACTANALRVAAVLALWSLGYAP